MTLSSRATSQTLPKASQTLRRARVNGVELHYTDTGRGASVILLHGGMGDLESWPHQIRALSRRYRVLAYSRRRSHPNRNGNSPCTYFAGCIESDVDDLLSLQDTLCASPAHLLGTSYGALIALAVALRAPEKVASLVLAEPPLHRWACVSEPGRQLYEGFIGNVWRPAGEAFDLGRPHRAMQLLTNGMWGRPVFGSLPQERIEAMMRNAAAMRALIQSGQPFPDMGRSAVAALAVPTLLVQGELTSALHRQVMIELSAVMNRAKRVEIPFAGHGSPNENPDAYNAATLWFLDSLGLPTGDRID